MAAAITGLRDYLKCSIFCLDTGVHFTADAHKTVGQQNDGFLQAQENA